VKKIVMALGIIAVVLCQSVAGAVEEKPVEAKTGLTPEQIGRLEEGKVVLFKKGSKDAQGNSLGKGRVMMLVDKPCKEVIKCLWDHDAWPEYMPHLVKIEDYYKKDNEIGVHETLRILLNKVQYYVIHTYDEKAGTLSWRLDKSKKNDINDTTGSWTIKPYGQNRTLIDYSVTVDSGMPIPKFIENFLFNRDLPGVAKALKKRVESNGAYKK